MAVETQPAVELPPQGTVRAKFTCLSVDQHGWTGQDGMYHVHSEHVRMIPVYSPDPGHENRRFWRATPSGELRMYIENPGAFGTFREGREYYLDFTPADAHPAGAGG